MRCGYPGSGLQKLDAITQAKNHNGFGKVRKRQAVDLVFGDKDVPCGNVQSRKIAHGNCERSVRPAKAMRLSSTRNLTTGGLLRKPYRCSNVCAAAPVG
jgi:hypothetical protein